MTELGRRLFRISFAALVIIGLSFEIPAPDPVGGWPHVTARIPRAMFTGSGAEFRDRKPSSAATDYKEI